MIVYGSFKNIPSSLRYDYIIITNSCWYDIIVVLLLFDNWIFKNNSLVIIRYELNNFI